MSLSGGLRGALTGLGHELDDSRRNERPDWMLSGKGPCALGLLGGLCSGAGRVHWAQDVNGEKAGVPAVKGSPQLPCGLACPGGHLSLTRPHPLSVSTRVIFLSLTFLSPSPPSASVHASVRERGSFPQTREARAASWLGASLSTVLPVTSATQKCSCLHGRIYQGVPSSVAAAFPSRAGKACPPKMAR